MDQPLKWFYGLRLDDSRCSAFSDHEVVNGLKSDATFVDQNFVSVPPLPPDSIPSAAVPLNDHRKAESHEDFDCNDAAIKFISEMLLEEDIDEKMCMFQESAVALHAAERSLYELIGEKNPPPASLDESNCGPNPISQSASQCNDSGTSSDTAADGFVGFKVSNGSSEIVTNGDSALHFKKGFKEATSKFSPNDIFIDLESNGFFQEGIGNIDKVEEEEEKHGNVLFPDGSRGKKNPYPDDLDVEEDRNNKQSAVQSGSTVSAEEFDRVLLDCGEVKSALHVSSQDKTSNNLQQNGQVKGSIGGKVRGRKKGAKRNVIDLRTLLTLCAQAVAANDQRTANDFLKQIRQNASPMGDGMQRLALVFADGLEARLAGSGTQVYRAMSLPTSAADILKAYHMFLVACPMRNLTNFFSDKAVMNVAEKATKLHIVDFGILYGFQWPSLIQRLSSRPGGPPELRITGIDLPHPGFRPAQRVEETGCRLANYAKRFSVPFKFHAIAEKWETIKLEDLGIEKDEVLVVMSQYRLRNLLDETVVMKSPRNIVLNLIRSMNPHVFIQGVVNGGYSVPFFITRFREALFHYSTLFDMLDANVPRELPGRMLLEREIFGKEAMNVIACEGAERIERPETYKQWQMRILRAGFRQIPLNKDLLMTAKEKVKELYHKDFIIDEDSHWLLQGWKGRIIYALSSWKPDCNVRSEYLFCDRRKYSSNIKEGRSWGLIFLFHISV